MNEKVTPEVCIFSVLQETLDCPERLSGPASDASAHTDSLPGALVQWASSNEGSLS